MNKKSHTIITAIFLVGLWIFVKYILKKEYFIWVFILPSIAIAWAPDIDQAVPMWGHRSCLTHSIIPEVVLFLFILPYEIDMLSFLFLVWIPVIGLHDLADCRWNSRKRTGYYTIKVLMRPAFGFIHKETGKKITIWKTWWGLGGGASTLYLIINFIVSIIILGVFLWVN